MNIQDTGIRGYLKWLQADQPAIYAAIAPHLAQQVPEAFSDYEQSHAMGALMGLADDGVGFDTTGWVTETQQGATDVASAANQGASSPSVTSIINNLVNAASSAVMAKSQADLLRQLNQPQLQQAQLGLSPLGYSTTTYGIPRIPAPTSSTMSGSGIAIGIAAVIGGLWLMSGRNRARA